MAINLKNSIIEIFNADKSTSKITLFYPEKQDFIKGVIVIFPAMGVRGSYYEKLAETFAQKGRVSITTDLRGIANSSIRASRETNFGYKEMIELDYESIITKVESLFPNQKIYILGHSLGGQLGSLFAAKNPNRIAGLILIACCSVFYKGWGSKQYFTLLMTQFTRVVTKLLGYFPGRKLGFGGTEAKTVMRDWSEQSRTGKYILKNDNFDYEAALSILKIPILAISFQQDTYAPRKAIKYLLGKFKNNTQITYEYLLNDDPRNHNFNHFNWVKNPDNIVEIVEEWLK